MHREPEANFAKIFCKHNFFKKNKMKVVIAFSLLIATIAGLPQQSTTAQLIIEGLNQNNERIVTGNIIKAIEEAKESIVNAGLDPFHREGTDIDYALPVPVLFNIQAVVEEILFTGLSNIVVHNMNYSVLTSRLTFDIRLPLLEFTLGKVANQVTVFGSSTENYASGRVAIVGIRLAGNLRVNIGIISGISLRSLTVDFTLGGIESDLKIISLGQDWSDFINDFLGITIPAKLIEYSKEVNEVLEIVGKQVIEANL